MSFDLYRVLSSLTSNSITRPINDNFFHSQIGTNNCVARYRTLGGGIGGSPTPTHSSDYVDDEEEELTDNTSVLNGVGNFAIDSSVASAATKHLKGKQNNSSVVSYQKANVHHVSF